MHKGRLEAFSDAVIAIIMTIMVLDLHAPKGSKLADLTAVMPTMLCYVLSFVFLGIYWNNHHHMLQAAKHVNGNVLWANMFLLFWLSLIPFATDWMGAQNYAQLPVAVYALLLFMCGAAYYLLSRFLIMANGKDSTLANAVGSDLKGILSVVIYAIAFGLSWVNPFLSCGCFVIGAVIWFLPDRRIERHI